MTQTKTYNDPRCVMTLAEIEAELRAEFRAAYPSLESFIAAHPIIQDFHFGGWGFARYADGVDLRQCRYPSEAYAETVRRNEYAKRFGHAL